MIINQLKAEREDPSVISWESILSMQLLLAMTKSHWESERGFLGILDQAKLTNVRSSPMRLFIALTKTSRHSSVQQQKEVFNRGARQSLVRQAYGTWIKDEDEEKQRRNIARFRDIARKACKSKNTAVFPMWIWQHLTQHAFVTLFLA